VAERPAPKPPPVSFPSNPPAHVPPMATVVSHAQVAARPAKPQLGVLHGAVDEPYFVTGATTQRKRDTFINPHAIGSQSPEEVGGIHVGTIASPRKNLAGVIKPRPLAIAPEAERTVSAHPASTKRRKFGRRAEA
jgi:hypothetical protein